MRAGSRSARLGFRPFSRRTPAPHALEQVEPVDERVRAGDLFERVAAQRGRFGRLTTLVNNAAVLHIAPIAQTGVEDYLRVTRVNELGTFLGIRAAIAPLKRAGGGSIVNVGSIDASFVAAGTSAYAASKFAVRGLTKVAALELGRDGIRVNAVHPGMGNPEMIEPFLPPGLDMEGVRKAHPPAPVGRRGTLEDVAHAVAFLASDESGYFHGADLALDGGTSAGMTFPGGIPGRRR